MSKVLLARPSSLLVQNMQRLMKSANLEPVPLKELNDFSDFKLLEISGIVISTALSSSVKEKYCEVMVMAYQKFPQLPKYLASFASFERAEKIARASFLDCGLPMTALSVTEAVNRSQIDFSKNYIIITQLDLEVESNFQLSLKMIKQTMCK